MAWRQTVNTERNGRGQAVTMWTPRLEKRVERLYVEQYLSLREVADRLSCSLGAVQNLVNRKGWMRGKTTSATLRRSKEIQRLYQEEGLTFDEIGHRLKLHGGSVRYHLLNLGMARTASESAKVAYARGRSHNSRSTARLLSLANSVPDTFKAYAKLVRALTTFSVSIYEDRIDKCDSKEQVLHADHKLSVQAGWYKWCDRRMMFVKRKIVVPPSIMAHPCNLQLITPRANSMKQSQSTLTVKKLHRLVDKSGLDAFDVNLSRTAVLTKYGIGNGKEQL